MQILEGLRDRYEQHHKVKISDEALAAAADLADRYISERFLPDKAIDLIDEAASRLRIKSMSQPPVYRDLEDEIDETRRAKEASIEAQEFEKAANLRDKERQLTAKKRELEEEWNSGEEGTRPVVGEEEIADIVSMWTGIPVFKLTEAETKKLVRMEEELHKRVVGQEVAITAVSKAIRRARAGIKDPKRPSGSFIFLGPSGVGKTELARTLAEFLFGDEDSMTRIDMSEYMEKHAVSRLVGSPPGYVGYDEGGQLTEAVRRKPYCVLLLDEIEKAHPDVFNILLQILEDGRLTDAQGRTVDFRNAIVIMTSNVGAQDIARNTPLGFAVTDETGTTYDDMKKRIMGDLKKVFRPEFLNRIDEVIVFHKLSRDEIKVIIDLLIGRVRTQISEHELQLDLTDEAKDLLVEKGWDPSMGARPLRRAIQRYIEDPLADEVLKAGPDSIASGTTVLVSRDEAGDENDQPLKLELIAPDEAGRRTRTTSSPSASAPRAPSEDEPAEDSAGEEPGAGGRSRRVATPAEAIRRPEPMTRPSPDASIAGVAAGLLANYWAARDAARRPHRPGRRRGSATSAPAPRATGLDVRPARRSPPGLLLLAFAAAAPAAPRGRSRQLRWGSGRAGRRRRLHGRRRGVPAQLRRVAGRAVRAQLRRRRPDPRWPRRSSSIAVDDRGVRLLRGGLCARRRTRRCAGSASVTAVAGVALGRLQRADGRAVPDRRPRRASRGVFHRGSAGRSSAPG